MLDTTFKGLEASRPEPLPFAKSLFSRAFTLRRPAGDLVVYASPGLEDEGAISAQYLNHWHEATLGGGFADAPLVIHAADAPRVKVPVARTFAEPATLDGDFELIPIPGHTPGATAFLWNSGEQRFLFTGDSVYLSHGRWIAAVLGDSDRAAYLQSLERLREIDFDVLVPWAAEGECWAPADDARERIDAIVTRLRNGEDR
jgi:glyoxylase-like metal-dependent hydrolase (beta-lactamase superfamily II)